MSKCITICISLDFILKTWSNAHGTHIVHRRCCASKKPRGLFCHLQNMFKPQISITRDTKFKHQSARTTISADLHHPTLMRVCATHTHTHIHTNTHTHTNIHTHTFTYACTPTDTHTYRNKTAVRLQPGKHSHPSIYQTVRTLPGERLYENETIRFSLHGGNAIVEALTSNGVTVADVLLKCAPDLRQRSDPQYSLRAVRERVNSSANLSSDVLDELHFLKDDFFPDPDWISVGNPAMTQLVVATGNRHSRPHIDEFSIKGCPESFISTQVVNQSVFHFWELTDSVLEQKSVHMPVGSQVRVPPGMRHAVSSLTNPSRLSVRQVWFESV